MPLPFRSPGGDRYCRLHRPRVRSTLSLYVFYCESYPVLTAATLHQQLKEITALCDLEFHLIEEERWEDVETTETQRQELIRQTFSEEIPDQLADSVRQAIAQLTNKDKQIRELVSAARQRKARELQKFRKGSKAANSYNKTGLL